ncbi:MAG: hypothetical protein ACLSXC_11115 [Beduini sp.]
MSTIDVGKAIYNYFGYIFSVGSLPETIRNEIEDKTSMVSLHMQSKR